MSLSGLHQKYLRYCEVERRLASLTVTAYRSDFAQFIEFLRRRSRWGVMKDDTLATFSISNVRDYQYDMAEQQLSTRTIQRRLVALNRFGAWLVRRGYTAEHPLADLELPPRGKRLPRIVAWSALVRLVDQETDLRDRAILAVLTYAGLRRGEVLRLDVRDYRAESKSVHANGKGNKDRTVALPQPACDALDAYLRERGNVKLEDPMFVSRGRRIGPKVIIRTVKRAGVRLGQHLHPHMFRHSYATELVERGADIRDIRDLLGHESVATTEIYTHVSVARQRRVVALLETAGR